MTLNQIDSDIRQVNDQLYRQGHQIDAMAMAQQSRQEHLHKLAKAGIAGVIILGVIALVAGILALLPRPIRTAVILAAIGWVIWTVATLPKVETTPVADSAPRAELVQPVATPAATPLQPLRYDAQNNTWVPDTRFAPRAALVNAHPKVK
jgi:hypothetical protein